MAIFFTTPSRIGVTFYELLANGEIEKHFYVSAIVFLAGLGLSIVVGLPARTHHGKIVDVGGLAGPLRDLIQCDAAHRPIAAFDSLVRHRDLIEDRDRLRRRGLPVADQHLRGRQERQPRPGQRGPLLRRQRVALMKIVVLPNSLPYIIAGLRLAIGRAILGVVVGEFFGPSQGLGYMIASAATNYTADVVFVGVIIFMVLSVILTSAVKSLESRLASWRPETAKTF